jgi:hypothetical protein
MAAILHSTIARGDEHRILSRNDRPDVSLARRLRIAAGLRETPEFRCEHLIRHGLAALDQARFIRPMGAAKR